MSAGEHKMGGKEYKKAEGMMDANQSADSEQRINELYYGSPMSISSFPEDFKRYRESVERIEKSDVPPQWKKDAERAKQIESEIQERLAELQKLFSQAD